MALRTEKLTLNSSINDESFICGGEESQEMEHIQKQLRSIQAWGQLVAYLQPINIKFGSNKLKDANFLKQCFHDLTPHLMQQVLPWYMAMCERKIQKEVVEPGLVLLKGLRDLENFDLIRNVHKFVRDHVNEPFNVMCGHLAQIRTILDLYGTNIYGPTENRLPELRRQLMEQMNALFFLKHYELFNLVFFQYYNTVFGLVNTQTLVKDLEGAGVEKKKLDLKLFNGAIVETGKMIRDLGWLGKLEQAFSEVALRRIDRELNKNYSSRVGTNELDLDRLHQENMLLEFSQWQQEVVGNYLDLILPKNTLPFGNQGNGLRLDWSNRIDFYMYEEFGKMRTQEIFDIVIGYPDSIPAMRDLKTCVDKTLLNFHDDMVDVYTHRLLHSGATTDDIITTYIRTIRALRILDPSGVALQKVGDPIRDYLVHRDDTIRSVVTHMLDDDKMQSELEENLPQKNYLDVDSLQWHPDPVDSDPNRLGFLKKTDDLITYLVNVFGSRDAFVSEYRTLLADRLLNRDEEYFNVHLETKNLELLKLRFGEHSLNLCDVMVKDLHKSQRFDEVLKEDREDLTNVSVTLISKEYWPQMQIDEHKWPKQVTDQFNALLEEYEMRKKPRSLKWFSNLGSVTLELEIAGEMVDIICSPLCASLLLHLQELIDETDKPIPVEQLSTISECTDVVRVMNFWVKRGVVLELYDGSDARFYSLPKTEEEELFAYQRFVSMMKTDDTDIEPTFRTNLTDEVNDETISNTVMGMLNNQGSKKDFRQIFNLFKMYQISTDLTKLKLQRILSKLVAEGKLVGDDGWYSRTHKLQNQ